MKCAMLALAVCSMAATTATWGLLCRSTFETPDFTPGQPLNGQGGWVALDPLPASRNAAKVVQVIGAGNTGRRAVRCETGDLGLPYDPEWYDGYWEHPIDFDALTNPAIVRVEADVKVVGPDTGNGPGADVMSANLMARNGSGRAAFFFLSSNGNAYANANYDDNGTTRFVRYQHETPINMGEYNHLAIILNYKTHIAAFEVNGKIIGTLRFGGQGEKFMSALIEAAAWNDPSFDHTKYTSYWDNVTVIATPAR